MKRLILLAAMSAVVLSKPKPETYRETEDFQYSRSSSDDGHKSGFYGAQRGNMGGNYERAHNMDNLAQHQMSGLVRQVDGELGEGANTRTGSVYTAANSRGIYGSGNYDLSNLKGRNFAEGESIGSSQSHSSLTSQNSGYRGYSYGGMNSAGYSSSSHAQDSRYSGYQSSGHADQRQIDNLQAVDMSQGQSIYENGNQAGYNMNHRTQYASHGQSELDQTSSNLYGSSGFNGNSQRRYITTPVRVVLRPGGRVAIPIGAPTYDVSQSSLSEDKNTDAEVLNQQTNFRPTNKVKHYESSYSYKKEWEKHNSQPADVSVIVPTENPFPKNSELYDDAQLLQSSKDQLSSANLQTSHFSNENREHRANTNSAASSRSRIQSGFNTQQSQSGFNAHHSQSGFNAQQSSAASDTHALAYGHGAQHSGTSADLTSAAENIDLKPKSYQSSYSYHKSWERQGDPYVIKPVGTISNGQASQRLTAGLSNSAAYSSHQYGSHSRQAQHSYSANSDCDEEGHVRVTRSYNTEQQQQLQSEWQQGKREKENLEDLGQETETKWQDQEDLGQQLQQNKWDNLQELGQQTQNQWDNLQQLGQETQNQWDNLQQLGQQSQNQWDNLQQLGQQTQDKWDKLEDLGQQTQRDLEQSQRENLEDFSQHNQKEDVLTNFEQQANSEDQKSYTQQENQPTNWDQISDFETQRNTANIGDINPHIQSGNKQENNNNFNKPFVSGFEQNPWFQTQDKNINSNNFMKPIMDDNCEHDSQKHTNEHVLFNVNGKPNLFPTPFQPLSNTEFSPWPYNNEQSAYWNHNHITNYNHRNIFWQNNEHHNKQFEHHFHSNSFSTNDTETSLKGLWDKIDNIAKEYSVTDGKTDDKYSHDYSNFHSYNQRNDHVQNNFNWDYTPAGYPYFGTPPINTDNKEETNIHHNLFEEEIPNKSTTVKPYKVPLTNPKPVENAILPFNDQDTQPSHHGQNIHSDDVGRGDIGPEETLPEVTTGNKPEKTPEEIESLSMTKKTPNEKPDDTIIQSNSTKNKNENATFLLSIPVTTSTSFISSTAKSDQFHSVNPIPTTEDSVLYNRPSTYLENQKPHKQTVESEEIPQNMEQQNLEQQSVDDFGQQVQSSWLANNLEQEHNQQDMEQQFEVFHQNENGKPYKNPEEIETLSLTKEMRNANTDNINTQPNVMNNIEQNADNNVNIHEHHNENKQQSSFAIYEPLIPTSTPSVQSSTTIKSNHIYHVNHKPSYNAIGFNSKPLTETQDHRHQEQTTECVETLEDEQQQFLEHQFTENLDQQLQSSWAGDNLQQGYDQQNMEQQFEVFQQHENMQDLTSLQDFGQQAQSSLQSFENIHQIDNSHTGRALNNFEQKLSPPLHSRDINMEPTYTGLDQTDHNINGLQEKQNIEDNKSPPEEISKPDSAPVDPNAENPGFWKSVGNKFSSAKNKVFSWFKRS